MHGVSLDRSAEPWVGVYPGLGEIAVAADGTFVVAVQDAYAPTIEDLRSREDALRHGWGEPLSWARRGFLMLHGGCVTPDPTAGALLLTGDLHEFGRLLPALSARGWSFLSDRYTPAEWREDALVAHPVAAPILLSERRAEKSGWTGRPVRGDTDALAVEVSRHELPVPIRGVVQLQRARPDEPLFVEVRGHERFEMAASLSFGGVLTGGPEDDQTPPPSAELMQEYLRFTALPMGRLRSAGVMDQLPDEAHVLVDWWSGITGVES